MAFIGGFGSYVPERIVGNAALAAILDCTPEWILEMSGIEERRYAAPSETIADMAVAAAQDCLQRAGVKASEIGAVLLASGSADRRFPGPAASLAHRLNLAPVPALDIPMASAGSLFALGLAEQLAPALGDVLVVGSEKMSTIVTRELPDKNVAILFGDGAGACLVRASGGPLRIAGSVLHSDGSFAEDLRLGLEGPIAMNGRSVIMQASRKMPSSIREVLERTGTQAEDVEAFLLHQANQNLIDRVARILEAPLEKFFSNIRRYGNTSSASMLIAAAEWWPKARLSPGSAVCFSAFGAGFHWGALLARA